MKDFDNELDNMNNGSYNDFDSKKTDGDFSDDNKAFKNIEKGEEKDKKGAGFESQNNEKEAKTAFSQGEDNKGQEANDRYQAGESERVEHQYSSYYRPPYYVPDFTVKEQNTSSDNKKKVRAIIATVVAVSVILALAIAFSGYKIAKSFNLFWSSPENDLDDGESLMGNIPSVTITQNVYENYEPQTLPQVVSKVGNSVVEITTSSIQVDRFYGQYVTSGAGSGVLIAQNNQSGYLLTNYHVIASDDGKLADTITVVLTNSEEYEASVIGSDSSIDLALLVINKKNNESFTLATFGKSSDLVVGQDVIAIGNPLGSLGGTVTDGIISALDRRVKIDNVEMVLLQHNAAINPGNSGGALFDMMGNLIGIVNAKTSDTGIEGLGFAIPSDIAANFVNRKMVVEPEIGIRVQYGKLGNVLGLYVVETTNPEFKKYDRVIKVNGEAIENPAQYYAIIDALQKGDSATVTVKRNGSELSITVTRAK